MNDHHNSQSESVQYENWFSSHALSTNSQPNSTGNSNLNNSNVPGFKLSVRRGPEVELYDVARNYLLQSQSGVEQTSLDDSSLDDESRFQSCLSTSKHKQKRKVFFKSSSTNKENYLLKNKHSTNEFNSNRLPTKVLTSQFIKYSLDHDQDSNRKINQFGNSHFSCFQSKSIHHSNPFFNRYKHYFTLSYHQIELSTFIGLNLFLSICYFGVLMLERSSSLFDDWNLFRNSRSIIQSTNQIRINLFKLILLGLSIFLFMIGLLLVYWPMRKDKTKFDDLTQNSDCPIKLDHDVMISNEDCDLLDSNDGQEKFVNNLLRAQNCRRSIQWARFVSYVAIIILALVLLPWDLLLMEMIEYFQGHDEGISYVLNQIHFYNCTNLQGIDQSESVVQ